jgi:hypothetical protein
MTATLYTIRMIIQFFRISYIITETRRVPNRRATEPELSSLQDPAMRISSPGTRSTKLSANSGSSPASIGTETTTPLKQKEKLSTEGREIDIRRVDVEEIPCIESEDISSLQIGV